MSSSLVLSLLLERLFECMSLGKVDLRGVNAVTTFRAELRILARISHDRFFARYHNTAETAWGVSAQVLKRMKGTLTSQDADGHSANDDGDYCTS